MPSIQEIDKAISAHGMWKTRLKSVVATGQSEVPPALIKVDNQCEFGKWLYSPALSQEDKASDNYSTVRRLHSEFHKVAGRVVELAVGGNRSEAEALLSMNGEFSTVSAQLTQAMMAWKKEAQ